MATVDPLGILAGVGGVSTGSGVVALALDPAARFHAVDELQSRHGGQWNGNGGEGEYSRFLW